MTAVMTKPERPSTLPSAPLPSAPLPSQRKRPAVAAKAACTSAAFAATFGVTGFLTVTQHPSKLDAVQPAPTDTAPNTRPSTSKRVEPITVIVYRRIHRRPAAESPKKQVAITDAPVARPIAFNPTPAAKPHASAVSKRTRKTVRTQVAPTRRSITKATRRRVVAKPIVRKARTKAS
jgi:hypothetical protein